MRLVTYTQARGEPRLGLVQNEQLVVDVSAAAPSMLALIQAGADGLDRVRQAAATGHSAPLEQVRLLAPIPRPSKNVFCLGLNYKEHVAESAAGRGANPEELPKYPIWFTKAVTSLTGPYDDIRVDLRLSDKYDWEVELAVVIGKGGRNIPKERAYEYVHSYSVFNDFSVRDLQRRHGGQWFKGKSLDKASPMGPWLVTPDEIADPTSLQVLLRVNGETKQTSNTNLLIFDIPTSIADLSDTITLEPGDIIATGTCGGIGAARKPPEFLKPGDVMETEIPGVGVLRNRIVAD